MKQIFCRLIAVVFLIIFSVGTSTPVQALSSGQKKLFQKNIHYFDFDECAGSSDTPSTGSLLSAGPVSDIYLLGDSVFVGDYFVTQDLKKDIAAEGWKSQADASGGRGMSFPGSDPRGSLPGRTKSGLGAIDADANAIKQSDTLVIELGTNETNPGAGANKSTSLFKDEVSQAINKLQRINSTASIYWVNISAKVTHPYTPWVKEYNQAIQEVATAKNIKVIDAANADISLTSDKVHPDAAGYKKLSRLIVDSLKTGGSSANTSVPSACSCGAGGDTNLVGSDNAEKIFNFFISKGLKPFQSAGIIGNMMHESGLDPEIIQGGAHTKDPAEAGSSGWGLVQWTPATKAEDIAKAAKITTPIYELGTQLEMVWAQLDGKAGAYSEKNAGNDVKQSIDAEDAVRAFQGDSKIGGKYIGFERPADEGGSLQSRIEGAEGILTKYGSGSAGGGATGSGSSSCATDGSGTLVGEFSLPVDQKWFDSNPEWFSKPHHDHPSADIPVPAGTKVYSSTGGKVIAAFQTGDNGGMGTSVLINYRGAEYGYFHGIPGSVKVKTGETVQPGQQIMNVDNTGASEGDHLHFQIKVGGVLHCPQTFLTAIGKGNEPPMPADLPTTGCTY